MKKILGLLVSLAMVVSLAAGCGTSAQQTAGEKETSAADTSAGESKNDISIILITMDSLNAYWVGMDEGAKAECEKLGVTYQWMAPDQKDDQQQIERINNAVAAGADAILIAANGPDTVSSALKEAQDQGVKIVYVDSPANLPAVATFCTDNEAAGRTAGEQLLAALKEKGVTSGKLGIVNVNAATDSVVKREAGFRSAFEGTDFEILETQYAEGDAQKAQDIATGFITQGVVGIFGTNENCAIGVGNAIKGSGAAVTGVGFDPSDTVKELIRDGSLLCAMQQNPGVMGQMGVDAAVKAIRGEDVGAVNVDTGVTIVTKDNL